MWYSGLDCLNLGQSYILGFLLDCNNVISFLFKHGNWGTSTF